MIDACLELSSAFEAMSNKPEFPGELDSLTSVKWQQVKSVMDFLQLAYELNNFCE
jgi:hypothetical protein